MTKTANINIASSITAEQLAAIVSAAVVAALGNVDGEAKQEAEPKAETKAEAKQAERRAKHDAILDSKRVERMTKTAQDKLAAQGFETKASKQGAWVWVYPCAKSSGKGRAPEFKAAKLAKGWKYSPKRAAFYRDFS